MAMVLNIVSPGNYEETNFIVKTREPRKADRTKQGQSYRSRSSKALEGEKRRIMG